MVKRRLPNSVGKGGGKLCNGRLGSAAREGSGMWWCRMVSASEDGWSPVGFGGGSLPPYHGVNRLGLALWLTAELSRRYAEVVVASENSVHKLLELLPGKILNGDKVEVRLATRQNLSQFEAQARKRE